MKKGFTLIELLVVIAIVAILGAVCLGGGGCQGSEGSRKGSLTKLSERGLVFKTWEGELVMGGLRSGGDGGSAANVWAFSVYADNPQCAALVAELKSAIEHDTPVVLNYRQYPIRAFWNASTSYDIQKVNLLTNVVAR